MRYRLRLDSRSWVIGLGLRLGVLDRFGRILDRLFREAAEFAIEGRDRGLWAVPVALSARVQDRILTRAQAVAEQGYGAARRLAEHLLAAGGGEAHGVALVEDAGALELHRPPGHEQVQVRRLGQLHRLAGPQPGGVEGGVAVADADGRGTLVAVHPRGHGHQPAREQLAVDLQLLVAGGDAGLVGHDPHLHEVDRL